MPSPAIVSLLAPTLAALGAGPREAFERLRDHGFRRVQLDAMQPETRPRSLGRSARRDLIAALRRRELAASGIDLWIPPAHFLDPKRVDRAVAAVTETIELAADLGRVPVSLVLPGADEDGPVRVALAATAERFGVAIADHAVPVARDLAVGIGLDPSAWLAAGEDPAAAVLAAGPRLASARLSDLLSTGLRGPLGDASQGRLDTIAYRAALDAVGYDRPVVIDARQWPDAWTGIVRTAEAWDACGLGA